MVKAPPPVIGFEVIWRAVDRDDEEAFAAVEAEARLLCRCPGSVAVDPHQTDCPMGVLLAAAVRAATRSVALAGRPKAGPAAARRVNLRLERLFRLGGERWWRTLRGSRSLWEPGHRARMLAYEALAREARARSSGPVVGSGAPSAPGSPGRQPRR